MERQKERDRVRVLKAADRRENWISMVVNDPEFLEGRQKIIALTYMKVIKMVRSRCFTLNT